MEPVAACRESLQGSACTYMGSLLPTLHAMKIRLEELRTGGGLLQYAQPLVVALLQAYEARFGHLYEDMNVLLASALHPHYTPVVLSVLAPAGIDAIKQMLVTELKQIISSEVEVEEQPGPSGHQDVEAHLPGGGDAARRSQEVEEAIDQWVQAPSDIPISRDLFPVEHRAAWLQLFIKYNTALPSSTAMERLFSAAGGDILGAKRSSLHSSNFEQLVFLRGNIDLLTFTEEEEKIVEQEMMVEEEEKMEEEEMVE